MKKVGIVLVVIAAAVGLFWVTTYSGLVSSSEKVSQTWGQVENVYQRRLDLIPNLVETVKGYAAFERSVLTEVTNARAGVGKIDIATASPEDQQKYVEAQKNLSGALSRLLVVVERYPDLKANQGFRDLQSQIEGSENRIAVERRNYQLAVGEYNVKVRGPLSRFVASFHGFSPKPYFEADAGAKNAPKVKF